MTSNPIEYSFVGSALNKASFRIEETDSRITAISKFTAGRTANALLALAALVETVVFAALTVVGSPLYFISSERFSSLTQHTSASAYAGTKALKETIGMIDEVIQKQQNLQPTKWEIVNQMVREKTAKMMEHRGKITAACFTTIALVLLYNYRSAILGTLVEKSLPQCTLDEAPLLALPRFEDTHLGFSYKLAHYTEDLKRQNAVALVKRAKQITTEDPSNYAKTALYYGGIALRGLAFAGKRTGQAALIATAGMAVACASVPSVFFGVSMLLE